MMAVTLLEQARTPSRVTKCPKYFTPWAPKAQFPRCNSSLAFRKASQSCLRWDKGLAHVSL